MILTDGIHLVSDNNLNELHDFATVIGLKREWFQNKRLPHYDLTTTRKFNKAVAEGAEIVTSREVVKGVHRYLDGC